MPSCGRTQTDTRPPCCPALWCYGPGERTTLVQADDTAQFSTMAPEASSEHDRAVCYRWEGHPSGSSCVGFEPYGAEVVSWGQAHVGVQGGGQTPQ